GNSLVRAIGEKQRRSGLITLERIFRLRPHEGLCRLTLQWRLEIRRSFATTTSDLQTRCWRGFFCACVLQYFDQRLGAYWMERGAHAARQSYLKLPTRAPKAATKLLQLEKATSRCAGLTL